MGPVCREFIIYVYLLFKPIVLFQDMDTKQENVSHTADTTGECSQLLSNSLATGNSMVSVFSYFVIEHEVSFWLITNVFDANVKKGQVSKQFNKDSNQVLTSISDNVYHVFLAFSNFSWVSTITVRSCVSEFLENQVSTSISGRGV